MVTKIFCPYHAGVSRVIRVNNGKAPHFVCSECNSKITSAYIRERASPRDVISSIGYRGHGQACYFRSLFLALHEMARWWPRFSYVPLDERSRAEIDGEELRWDHLPPPTKISFPIPSVVKFESMPGLGNRLFLFYDTSGEAFKNVVALAEFAYFIRRSRTVCFFISADDLEYVGQMHELLTTYMNGMTALGGDTGNQHLVVVLNEADKLQQRLVGYDEVWQYLEEGGVEQLGNQKLGAHLKDMSRISQLLKAFVVTSLGEAQFANIAKSKFRSVQYCIVSALGAEPEGDSIPFDAIPKCIMDPLLWVSYKSLNPLKKILLKVLP